MPEHLRALVVILVIATCVFLVAQRPVCAAGVAPADYRRRRNLWLALTVIAFVAHDYWLFVFAAAAVLLVQAPKEHNKPALFLLLVGVLPHMSANITGLGIINHFFALTPIRLFTLVLLLPLALRLVGQPGVRPLGGTLPDKLLLGYLALDILLRLPVDTLTNSMRSGFNVFIDVILPYFVFSRALDSEGKQRDALLAFVLGAFILGAVALFEFSWGWLLYASLPEVLGVPNALSGYLFRGDILRAQATAGQPIPLGYLMAVALGIHAAFKPLSKPGWWWLGFVLLLGGLLVTISRGPWMGYAAIVLVLALIGMNSAGNLFKLLLLALIGAPVLLSTEFGQRLLDHLPFIGAIEEDTITYRQLLLEISLRIIAENPLFGSYDFVLYLEELRQGQGIIDIVNTYLSIALANGLVGLGLFLGFFVAVLARLFLWLRRFPAKADSLHGIGRSVLATMIGALVIIFTVSSISFIPVVYWSLAGLAVAVTARLQARTQEFRLGPAAQPAAAKPPRTALARA
ncbi:MAG: O-antigen ligase family protein [Sulfuritalea sp.]|nr:O-antigen ligase family protein [Sulfuritalea sp.]